MVNDTATLSLIDNLIPNAGAIVLWRTSIYYNFFEYSVIFSGTSGLYLTIIYLVRELTSLRKPSVYLNGIVYDILVL